MGSCRLVVVALLAAFGCASPNAEPPFVGPGPGLIFSYPGDGQLDVPTRARVAVAFSQPIDATAIGPSCSVGGGTIRGGLCLVGPNGPVAGAWDVVGDGRAAEFTAAAQLPTATSFELFIDPRVLEAGAGNISAETPVIHFTTRGGGSKVGIAPEVIGIQGDPADRFLPGSTTTPTFPVSNLATFRLVFSEPMDARTAVMGVGLEFVAVGAGGDEVVEGTVLAQGRHLSFDPEDDLEADRTYELRITGALRDLGGEAAVPQVYSFRPVASYEGAPPFPSVLDVDPGVGDQNFPQPSGISSLTQNNVELTSRLIGQNRIELLDGQVAISLGHPILFDAAVPVVIRRGQSLHSTGLDVALGGVVSAGLQTGDLRLSFASDVTGFLVRNRFWPASTIPDNVEAPLQVYLSFDIAVSGLDPFGNAVLTQTILGVQATGVAEVVDGELHIANVGALELDLLGITRAPTTLALAMSTTSTGAAPRDTDPPALLSTYPAPGAALFETTDSIVLTFTEPMRLRGSDAAELRTDFDAVVPAEYRASGSMIVITPLEPLEPGQGFRVHLGGGVADMHGNSWASDPDDPSGGSGVVSFTTAEIASSSELPPTLVTVYPGAPCSLPGQGAGNRHCESGEPDDGDYLPFELPANHAMEILFDQPMDLSSMTLGTACGEGAIRVEERSGNDCVRAIPGTLLRSERALRFVPESPWTPGQTYQLHLNVGGNSSCAPNELCGANGLPLNTNPLASADSAGGPAAVFFFVGTEVSPTDVIVTNTRPIVDRNGNAVVDADETVGDTNLASIRLAGVSGLVSSASFDMEDCDASTAEIEGCLHLSGDLVVRLEESQENCRIDTANGPIAAEHCVPVEVSPGALYGTQLTMDANILGLGLVNDLATGKIVLRTRQNGGPIRGFIVENASGQPELFVTLDTFMDAPDLSILGGLASHDLKSKELAVQLRGPVEFRDDGRLRIVLSNETLIALDVEIRTLGINSGTMSMEIAPGAMVVDFVSRSARGGLR